MALSVGRGHYADMGQRLNSPCARRYQYSRVAGLMRRLRWRGLAGRGAERRRRQPLRKTPLQPTCSQQTPAPRCRRQVPRRLNLRIVNLLSPMPLLPLNLPLPHWLPSPLSCRSADCVAPCHSCESAKSRRQVPKCRWPAIGRRAVGRAIAGSAAARASPTSQLVESGMETIQGLSRQANPITSASPARTMQTRVDQEANACRPGSSLSRGWSAHQAIILVRLPLLAATGDRPI